MSHHEPVPRAGGTPSPPVDLRRCCERHGHHGTNALMRLHAFESQAVADGARLWRGLSNEGGCALRSVASALADAAADVAADPIHDLARRVERALADGDMEQATVLAGSLTSEIDRLVAYLPVAHQALSGPPTPSMHGHAGRTSAPDTGEHEDQGWR